LDITKENFYDLYNMALCLLKSVDGLDPDKIQRKLEQPQAYTFMPSQLQGQPGMVAMQPGQPMSDLELQRKNYDYAMGGRPTSAFDASAFMSPIKYGIPTATGDAVYAYNQAGSEGVVPVGTYALPLGAAPAYGGSPFLKANDPLKPKNFTGEVFFDDINQGEDRRPKRRRRRTVYSSRRNLHCHMCGVTETPEWRRGPAGDHTLCNACGLHYAKSLKKQRKERDSRKHSIDMLLNEQQNQQALNGESPQAVTPGAMVPTSPNPTPTLTPAPVITSAPTPTPGEAM
jgi:transcription elongation factor Elf1